MEQNIPSSDLDFYILGEMCKDAAKGVEWEREYWMECTEGVRATQMHKLTSDERANLPTNNLNIERYLTKFGYLAGSLLSIQISLIRLNVYVTIWCSLKTEIEIATAKTLKILDEMEIHCFIGLYHKIKRRLLVSGRMWI